MARPSTGPTGWSASPARASPRWKARADGPRRSPTATASSSTRRRRRSCARPRRPGGSWASAASRASPGSTVSTRSSGGRGHELGRGTARHRDVGLRGAADPDARRRRHGAPHRAAASRAPAPPGAAARRVRRLQGVAVRRAPALDVARARGVPGDARRGPRRRLPPRLVHRRRRQPLLPPLLPARGVERLLLRPGARCAHRGARVRAPGARELARTAAGRVGPRRRARAAARPARAGARPRRGARARGARAGPGAPPREGRRDGTPGAGGAAPRPRPGPAAARGRAARARAEEPHREKAAAMARLARAEQLAAIGRLSAKMAHEVRNPLGAINLDVDMLTDIVRDGQGPAMAEAREIVREIRDGLRALAALTDEYLVAARLRPPRPEKESLNDLAADLVAFLRPSAERQGVVLELRLDPGLPLLPLDRAMVRQAAHNP